MGSPKIMISCFDLSCVMAEPWAEDGYECYCVDIQHERGLSKKGNIFRVGANVYDWLPPRGDIAFAAFFPPCTDVAVSGARWFRDKGIGRLAEAMKLFDWSVKIAEWCDAPYMIENPVSTISTYWRGPDHKFNPCDYGDPYTKLTCLWTGGGFVMPDKNPVIPSLGSKMHLVPPGENRSNIRSTTPRGFARAVWMANRKTESEEHRGS